MYFSSIVHITLLFTNIHAKQYVIVFYHFSVIWSHELCFHMTISHKKMEQKRNVYV